MSNKMWFKIYDEDEENGYWYLNEGDFTFYFKNAFTKGVPITLSLDETRFLYDAIGKQLRCIDEHGTGT